MPARAKLHLPIHTDNRLSPDQVETARRRFAEALTMQEIEGNPLDQEQIAMFEMFDREAWTDEQSLAFIQERARSNTGR